VNLLIRGGRVVDPSQGIDAALDVRIEGGLIVELGEHLESRDWGFDETNTLDATGSVVAPGFIDMHVHLREPGQTYKETIATGAAAAVAGGFSAVAAMPNTEPAIDSPELVAEVLRLGAAAHLARIHPIAAITRGRAGRELAPLALLHDAGAVAFSDDGATIADARVLRQAALYARDIPGPFIQHCEDASLKGDAVMHEGAQSSALGVPGSPALAEDVIVARDLLIADETGKAFHIAHLTSATSVDLIRFARARQATVTCEATPHHLLLSDDRFSGFRADAKVNPPLRSESDSEALRAAVRDGTIDVLASDHAPHAAAEKEQLLSAAPVGFSGLEIAVGAYALAFPDLPLDRFVALCSTNPARILGVAGGTLRAGSPADVTLFAEERWTVDASRFHSLGKNTPFDGWTFYRRPVATVVGGVVAMRRGRIAGR
jgi:dihydroorotase